MSITAFQSEALMAGLRDTSGQSLDNGVVETYAAGTTTPKTTWKDANKVQAHPNPIVLDGNGQQLAFFDGAYKLVVKDSQGAIIATWDNVTYVEGLSDLDQTIGGEKTFSGGIKTDTINEATLNAGAEIEGNLNKDGTLKTDKIGERSSGQGILFSKSDMSTDLAKFTVSGLLLIDGIQELTASAGITMNNKVLVNDLFERTANYGLIIDQTRLRDGALEGKSVFFGDGSDGAYSSAGSETLDGGVRMHTTFAVNSGHTVDFNSHYGPVIFATESITIDGTLTVDGQGGVPGDGGAGLGDNGEAGENGVAGGAGGGGGGGATTGGAGGWGNYLANINIGGSGGVVAGGLGGNGSAVPAKSKPTMPFDIRWGGGGGGGGGGNFPGAGGGGGGGFMILVAPTITINGSGVLSADGADGGNTTSNNGAGAGGGGGGIVIYTMNYTNTGTIHADGGSGGTASGGGGGDGGDGATGLAEIVEM